MTQKVVVFSGSLKQSSYNQTLAKIAADIAASKGAEVTVFSLREFPLPLFNEDIESEINPTLNDVRAIISQADALIISSPEYNGSLTPALKNTIDWVSRPADNYLPKFGNQKALIISASPGGLGGLRGLNHLRDILTNLGTFVLPNQLAVPRAYEAFSEDGALKDSVTFDKLEFAIDQLLALTIKSKA